MTEVTCKAPVSALQEYLMKKGSVLPDYEFREVLDDNGKVYQCQVTAMNEVAFGEGRSKREAKHEAADNVLKKFKMIDSNVHYNPQPQMPEFDAVSELRYLCIQRNHPFPQFEIVQETGPPPEFTCECSVASIVRYGTSSTKKWARQLAAQALIDIIQAIPVTEGIVDLIKHNEQENRSKFKIYKETIESDRKDQPGVLLSERHNYFQKLDSTIKEKAFAVLKDSTLDYSIPDKVDLLLKSLNIRHKMSNIKCDPGPDMLFIELFCDIDVVFAGDKEAVYHEILDYFKTMLN